GDGGQGGDGGAGGGPVEHVGRAGLFAPTVERFTVEVDYAPGAAPYVEIGGLLNRRDAWEIFEVNVEALFAAAPRELVIPRALAEMQALPAAAAPPGDYSSARIRELARTWRETPSAGPARSVYVVFLDGYYADDAGRRPTVLGISLGDTGIIALFKPVIDGTSDAALVEQTTLVHEFGHAAGLVANGLALSEPHHDAEHGAHCDNRDCVMYYLNESSATIGGFVGDLLGQSPVRVLFGDACLADAHAASD
ncbi:MAG: hypothetical protein H6705_20180, partial [Myxococcales bacterium]|nr:hypothetical protein [Myxococcales bacterium]